MLSREEIYNKLMKNINKEIDEQFELIKSKYKDSKFVIWGTGGTGNIIYNEFKKRNLQDKIFAFADNNMEKVGGVFNGKEIKSYDELKNVENCYFMIGGYYINEIKEQLKKSGENNIIDIDMDFLTMKNFFIKCSNNPIENYVECSNIINYIQKLEVLYETEDFNKKLKLLYDNLVDENSRILLDKRINFLLNQDVKALKEIYDDNIYFDKKFYKNINDKEVFADLGAYIGDSIEKFVKSVNNKYKKVYAFEPDIYNYKKLKETILKYNNIEIFNMGVGEENNYEKFLNAGDSSCINEIGDSKIQIIKLDSMRELEDITWIKMDIEGFEMEALKGATELIKKNKPKLAICLYHNVRDLVNIPLYLKEIVPEYKFKLGQHSLSHLDIVLYADI